MSIARNPEHAESVDPANGRLRPLTAAESDELPEAIRQAMAELAEIGDDTDTDEVWRKVTRGSTPVAPIGPCSAGRPDPVARLVVLDAGPLGLITKPRGKPDGDACRGWAVALAASRVRIVVPEVVDYEVRRDLLRAGATAGIRRLDAATSAFAYDPISTAAMRRAAEFWAAVRRAGVPTADPLALDADCILAAQASLVGGVGDAVTIATTNPGHLVRFPGIAADLWTSITG